MGKKVRLASKFSLQKCGKRARIEEDQISQLPDDILVSILSYLTLKEAVATSVLSCRWAYLWMFIPRLNFDCERSIFLMKFLETKRQNYVKWVNQVLQLYKGSMLEEFRIRFNFNKLFKDSINEWVSFALARGVQRLELDFFENGEGYANQYTFSLEFSNKSKGPSLEQPHLNYCSTRPCEFVSFKPIKALCLRNVNVSGEVLEFLLSYCPVLERLVVAGSGDLVDLDVIGPSLMLKHLEIRFCFNLKSIKICDTNIISFTFWGKSIHLLIKNVPLLSEVSVGGNYNGFLEDAFSKLSCCLAQLEVLTVHTKPKKDVKLLEIPELAKLKKLVLRLEAWENPSLVGFTPLVNAFSHLEKFVLKLEWYKPVLTSEGYPKLIRYRHQNLKVVELGGYYGRTSDVELATYFLESAVALEKLIIEPRCQLARQYPKSKVLIGEEEAARSRAEQQLRGKVPPHVQLVIL